MGLSYYRIDSHCHRKRLGDADCAQGVAKDQRGWVIFQMKHFSTPLIVLTIFALLFVLERSFPLRKGVRALGARLLVNFSVSALAFSAAAFLVRPAAQAALPWANATPFGLLDPLPVPSRLALLIRF